MFVPTRFRSPSAADAITYIQNNGFATIIGQLDGKMIASHIPLHYHLYKDGKEVLRGHISIGNELKHAFIEGQELLAIFMEHHAYISSSWYDHVNVPTWNYIAVHVYGKAHILDGEALRSSIEELVAVYEADSEKPFHTSQMSEKDYHAHLKGLIGFELEIDHIEAAWKLSQNRDDNNYFEIIRKLRERNDQLSSTIANEMERIRTK